MHLILIFILGKNDKQKKDLKNNKNKGLKIAHFLKSVMFKNLQFNESFIFDKPKFRKIARYKEKLMMKTHI